MTKAIAVDEGSDSLPRGNALLLFILRKESHNFG